MAGRHGIKMRSAALTAAMAACSARGGVSMNTRSAPAFPAAWRTRDSRAGWAETTAGDSASRRSDHLLVVACGSKIDDDHRAAGRHGGHCQGDCQSRFSGPTFLGDDGDYTHARPCEYTML